jgi:hypothetical protein
LEIEQKKTIERLAIVFAVIAVVILVAYIAYKPNEPKAPKASKAPAIVDRLPILAAHHNASLAVFQSGRWLINANGNGAWEGSSQNDIDFTLGRAGDVPLSGFWEGASAPSVGVFKDGKFSLLIEGSVRTFDFGAPGDVPVVGDWNADGHTKIGIFNKGFWILDMKGDGRRVDPPAGRLIALGGNPGETPLVGDWNGDGRSKVGVFNNGVFYLDFDGNGVWDKNDKMYYFGAKGDIPVVGDWNGDGRSKIGVFHDGFWAIDFNGNGKWEGPQVDRTVALGGVAGEIPLVGDWNGDGRSKVGVEQPAGSFHFDFDGNGIWNEKDKMFSFGIIGDIPVILDPKRGKK